MRLRTISVAVALAATLPACVVTVPLRTASVSESTLHRRPGRQATIVRLDSLGQRMPPERALDFRFNGETARWLDPTGQHITASRRQLHTVDVEERTTRLSFRAAATGFLVGGLGTLGVGALKNGAECRGEGNACGYILMYYGLISPGAGLASAAISAAIFADRRGPVRYVITPVRPR